MTEFTAHAQAAGTITPRLLGVLPDSGKIQVLLEVSPNFDDNDVDCELTVFGSPTAADVPEVAGDIMDLFLESVRDPEFVAAWQDNAAKVEDDDEEMGQ